MICTASNAVHAPNRKAVVNWAERGQAATIAGGCRACGLACGGVAGATGLTGGGATRTDGDGLAASMMLYLRFVLQAAATKKSHVLALCGHGPPLRARIRLTLAGRIGTLSTVDNFLKPPWGTC